MGYIDGNVNGFRTSRIKQKKIMKQSFSFKTSNDIPEFVLTDISEGGLYEVVVAVLSQTPYGSGASGSLNLGIRYTDEVGPVKTFPISIDLSQPGRQTGRVVFSAIAASQVKLFTTFTAPVGALSYIVKAVINRLDA